MSLSYLLWWEVVPGVIEASGGVRDDGPMLVATVRRVLVVLGFLIGLSAAAAALASLAHADPHASPDSAPAAPAHSHSSAHPLARATRQVGGLLGHVAPADVHPAPSSTARATHARPGTASPRNTPQPAAATPQPG
ncbi:MAG: hypothetical protein ACRDQ1_09945, partial [Sciscionella sp.]